DRSTASSGQVVLVGHRLRLRYAESDSDRSRIRGAALTLRVEGKSGRSAARPLLRSDSTAREGGPMDQDHPREGLVYVLPGLRSRTGRVRRHVETWRLRGGALRQILY